MTAEVAPTAANLLRDAKSALVDFGWQKGSFGTCETGFCAIGALLYADEVSVASNYRAWRDARDALAQLVPDRNIPRFNDAPETTLEDVLDLFDRAIERVDS